MTIRVMVGIAAMVTLLGSTWARGDDLPRADPEEVGFSSERLSNIDRYFTERIDQGDLAGIATLVVTSLDKTGAMSRSV